MRYVIVHSVGTGHSKSQLGPIYCVATKQHRKQVLRLSGRNYLLSTFEKCCLVLPHLLRF